MLEQKYSHGDALRPPNHDAETQLRSGSTALAVLLWLGLGIGVIGNIALSFGEAPVPVSASFGTVAVGCAITLIVRAVVGSR